MNNKAENRRIAKNTFLLYIRMFITMGVSLYTSRVVLSALGVEDYGIYNVVGGVVGLLGFLRSSLSTSTSRFLSYELGCNNLKKLRETFKTAIGIHIGLVILILVLLETIGLWFVLNKLTIPQERVGVAVFIYHFSVATCCVQIMQFPYNAAIIAHERMGAFAYISIIEVSLNLIIAYLLQISSMDKLELYAILLFFIHCIISLFYIIFAIRNFSECKIGIGFERCITKPMLIFSGWDLYGNFSVVVRSQGLNILQNMFFGPVINAAAGVSNQVMHAIMGFTENFLVAVRPQIYKNYAGNDMVRFYSLVINSSKYCFLLLFLISFPMLLEANFVMHLWLKKVPDYAVVFCQLTIVNNWISVMFRPIVFGVQATGQAKMISIINGTIYIAVLPLSYLFLKMGGSPIIPYVLNITLLIIGHFVFTLYAFKRNAPSFSIKQFLLQSPFKVSIIASLAVFIPLLVNFNMQECWSRFLLESFLFVIVMLVLIYYIAIDKNSRDIYVGKIMKKIRRL